MGLPRKITKYVQNVRKYAEIWAADIPLPPNENGPDAKMCVSLKPPPQINARGAHLLEPSFGP